MEQLMIPFEDYIDSLDRSLLSESAQSIVTVCSAVNLIAKQMADLPAERIYKPALTLCRMYGAHRAVFEEAFEGLATSLRKYGGVKAFSATEFVVRWSLWVTAMRSVDFSTGADGSRPRVSFSPTLPDFTDLQMEIGLECKRTVCELGLKAPKGNPGRRHEFSEEALNFAYQVQRENPRMAYSTIRSVVRKQFPEAELPPTLPDFRRWMNRHRAKQAN
jgi:hypothetical protein